MPTEFKKDTIPKPVGLRSHVPREGYLFDGCSKSVRNLLDQGTTPWIKTSTTS